jgi:hypothetical protein
MAGMFRKLLPDPLVVFALALLQQGTMEALFEFAQPDGACVVFIVGHGKVAPGGPG